MNNAPAAVETEAFTKPPSLHRPTPIPHIGSVQPSNDASAATSSMQSLNSIGEDAEEPSSGTASVDGSVSSLQKQSSSEQRQSRRASQQRMGTLEPLSESSTLEVDPGVPLLVQPRPLEGRTRSPSPDLRRVSPKVYEEHFPEDVVPPPHHPHGPPRHTNSLSAIREVENERIAEESASQEDVEPMAEG